MHKKKQEIDTLLTKELLNNSENSLFHTSYAEEKAILTCVSKGDVNALESAYYSLPETVYGKMTDSKSELKLLFYASISNTTLVTRYAIEGGLDEETAFSLSDIYIRKMEKCTTVESLVSLNEQMATEFTLRVHETKKAGDFYSPAVTYVLNSICHGKTAAVDLNALALSVNLTPKYLSALFHKETGHTLTDYRNQVLIEKAKNMLSYSDYSLGEISNYLNFATQSYFSYIFKKYTGMTPGVYRKSNKIFYSISNAPV